MGTWTAPSRNGDPKLPEIIKSASICSLIKRTYFADKTWFECYRLVGDKFTTLKASARQKYIGCDTDGILDILKEYDENDLREALDG